MMKLDYAGGEVIISDALSHALAAYSADIARTGGSQALQIPVLTGSGLVGLAEIVVGPASQLLATPTGGPEIDLDDAAFVDGIHDRSAALQPSKPLPISDEDTVAANEATDALDFPA
jgi:hypothetical protein